MGRWITVTEADTSERTLVNLDNVDAVQGRTISFTGGGEDNYLVAREDFDEIAKRIMRGERNK